jgi:TnpA family transposase
MAAVWGEGTDSSSDGQCFRAGGRAGPAGDVNAKYGIDPGVVLYTHHSGRYGPMYTRVISATASEAPYVLDGLHGDQGQRPHPAWRSLPCLGPPRTLLR